MQLPCVQPAMAMNTGEVFQGGVVGHRSETQMKTVDSRKVDEVWLMVYNQDGMVVTHPTDPMKNQDVPVWLLEEMLKGSLTVPVDRMKHVSA